MVLTKKDKHQDGWYTPSIIKPTMKWRDIKAEALLPNREYDDWRTMRDGIKERPSPFDYKIRRQTLIRMARRHSSNI